MVVDARETSSGSSGGDGNMVRGVVGMMSVP